MFAQDFFTIIQCLPSFQGDNQEPKEKTRVAKQIDASRTKNHVVIPDKCKIVDQMLFQAEQMSG